MLFVDKDGRGRLLLALQPDGSPTVSLNDSARGNTIVVAADTERAALFFTRGARERLWLGLGSDGSPSVSLTDYQGVTRAVLGVTSLETSATGATESLAPSSLVLFDREGKLIFRAP